MRLGRILRFSLQFEHCVPFSACGLSFISLVPLCFVYISEGRQELEAAVQRLVFLSFDVCVWAERTERCFVCIFL